jgi:DNA-binding transcriptional LysR family regulator
MEVQRPHAFSEADPLPGSELAAFTAAVESGSVQGAADALALTQSAATKRIQSLERRIGQELLIRGRAGVRPTEVGLILYPLARQALDALAEVGQAAGTAAAAGGAALRISASLTTGEFLLPGWLSSFRRRRPDAHPQLEIVNSSLVIEHVAARTAEMGFVEGPQDTAAFDTCVVARDELVVVVAADHRFARRASIKPAELLREPYLTREQLSGTRAVADAALQAVGVVLEPALEAASLQSLKRAIVSGGFTVISTLTIDAERRAGTLVGLPVAGVDLHRELRMIRLAGRRHREPASALWSWLASLAATPNG